MELQDGIDQLAKLLQFGLEVAQLNSSTSNTPKPKYLSGRTADHQRRSLDDTRIGTDQFLLLSPGTGVMMSGCSRWVILLLLRMVLLMMWTDRLHSHDSTRHQRRLFVGISVLHQATTLILRQYEIIGDENSM